MNLLKFAIVGAAVGYGVNYLLKKDENGRSVLDNLSEKAPGWFEQGKKFAEETVQQVKETVKSAV